MSLMNLFLRKVTALKIYQQMAKIWYLWRSLSLAKIKIRISHSYFPEQILTTAATDFIICLV